MLMMKIHKGMGYNQAKKLIADFKAQIQTEKRTTSNNGDESSHENRLESDFFPSNKRRLAMVTPIMNTS
jgi:hypothetical protein